MQSLQWHIGNVEIIQLVEMAENDIFNSFIPEATPDKLKESTWLSPYFIDENGVIKALVQSFLIRSNGKNILVDTCNGNDKKRPNVPTWENLKIDFLKRFEDVGTSPEQIDFVICTHLHFDHVGWNTKLHNGKWTPTFPNAKYLFSKQEYEYWVSRPEKEMIDDLNGIDDSVTPIVEAGLAKLVNDNFRIDENVSLIPTPGHTPHHVSVGIESDGEKAIITGDVMHHPCQIENQEWTTLADTYPAQTVETRKKFLREVTDTKTLVIGSHFNYPVAGRVVSTSNGLRLETQ